MAIRKGHFLSARSDRESGPETIRSRSFLLSALVSHALNKPSTLMSAEFC